MKLLNVSLTLFSLALFLGCQKQDSKTDAALTADGFPKSYSKAVKLLSEDTHYGNTYPILWGVDHSQFNFNKGIKDQFGTEYGRYTFYRHEKGYAKYFWITPEENEEVRNAAERWLFSLNFPEMMGSSIHLEDTTGPGAFTQKNNFQGFADYCRAYKLKYKIEVYLNVPSPTPSDSTNVPKLERQSGWYIHMQHVPVFEKGYFMKGLRDCNPRDLSCTSDPYQILNEALVTKIYTILVLVSDDKGNVEAYNVDHRTEKNGDYKTNFCGYRFKRTPTSKEELVFLAINNFNFEMPSFCMKSDAAKFQEKYGTEASKW